MKRLFASAALALALSLVAFMGQALAATTSSGGVNLGHCPAGKLVIEITHKVTNDADSGVLGNYWAYDNYIKHIQVWETAPGTFCALTGYEGHFLTVAGASPQGTDLNLPAGIKGAFEGGYRSTSFTGTLNPDPAYSTRGFIGTFNYGWDGTQQGVNNITPFDWVGTYFTSTSGFDLAVWGWFYQSEGDHGTWLNASTGNQGDIVG